MILRGGSYCCPCFIGEETEPPDNDVPEAMQLILKVSKLRLPVSDNVYLHVGKSPVKIIVSIVRCSK